MGMEYLLFIFLFFKTHLLVTLTYNVDYDIIIKLMFFYSKIKTFNKWNETISYENKNIRIFIGAFL